jgi:hypothetical protein
MLNRTSTRWTSFILIVTLLLTAIPPMTGFAAGERITVTNLYQATSIVNGRPSSGEDASIHRFTTNPITIEASIDGINSTQVPNIYYEVTNMNTGQMTTETANKAQMAGAFNIVFSNVFLSEGLNRIVLKMGGNVTISSEARWAYFIPTTSIQDLKVNGDTWDETKIYPELPSSSTAVNITGKAPNATDVQVQLYGEAAPKSLFLSNNIFLATGDDISKTTNADFKFTPGDNNLTLSALNSSKAYTLEKNLVYDNGDPFAYNARIQGIARDEMVTVPTVTNPVTRKYLKHTPVVLSSVEVYPQSNQGGTQLVSPVDYSVATETTGLNTGQSYIVFTGTSTPGNVVYVSYKVDQAKLKTNPTITPTRVQLDALIKNDVDSTNQGEYKYLEVEVGGETFGPYDLSQYVPAPVVSGHYPAEIHVGHSAMELFVTGSSLNYPGLKLYIEDSSGSSLTGSPFSIAKSADHFVAFSIPTSTHFAAGTYSFTVKKADGTAVGQFNQAVDDPNLSIIPPVVSGAAMSALNQGYSSGNALKLLELASAPPSASDILIEVFNLTGSSMGPATGISQVPATNNYNYTLPIGLPQGDYRVVFTVRGHIVTEKHLSVGPALLAEPTVNTVAIPETVGIFSAATPTFLVVQGTNFGTDSSKVTNAALVGITAPSTVALSVYSVEDTRIIFRVPDTASLSNVTGALEFTLTRNSATLLEVPNAIAPTLYVAGNTYSGNSYAGQAITDVNRAQISLAEAQAPATVPLTVTGLNLDATRLQIRIMREDGTSAGLGDATYTLNGANGAATIATAILPTGLLTGNYMLEFIDNDSDGIGTAIRLARYPLTVANPVWNTVSPSTVPISDLALTSTKLTVLGINLGRNFSDYSLRFADSGNITRLNLPATNIQSGSQLTFDSPTILTKGTYTVSLLYKGVTLANTRQFIVASEPAQLAENAARSKLGQYQVFDFSVEVATGTDLQQFVKFKFYNNPASPKYSTFRFTYVDPNLPYVERVERSPQNTPLSEVAANEVNELPTSFKVIADSKTNKINIYLGEYNSGSIPYRTMTITDLYNAATNSGYRQNSDNGKHEFYFKLDNIPNGTQKLTIVPSSNIDVTGDKKLGANPSGKKTYTMSFTNTPYLIVNNMYTGLVIRDDSEISCTGLGIAGGCITGR